MRLLWAAVFLLLLTTDVDGAKKKKKKKKPKKPSKQPHAAAAPQQQHAEGLPEGCGGRYSTHADVFQFLTDSLAGRYPRLEVEAQADWLLLDLEHGCTPGLLEDPAVFESLEDLTWQVLHDGPRTLKATQLRQRGLMTHEEKHQGSRAQLDLLRERMNILRRYGAKGAAAHGLMQWPPPAESGFDGHFPYPKAGCGSYPSKLDGPPRRNWQPGEETGGWLSGRMKKARARWGGRDSCTIRVLTVAEWDGASPQCLAALFSRPFLVRGGGEAIADRSRFQREAMLELAAASTVKISSLGQKSADGEYLPPDTPFLNLTALLANDGPAALAAGNDDDEAAVEQQHGSSISDPGSVGGRPGSLSVAPWGGDAAASLEMMKETGWLPGTFGGQLEAMRYETEHGGEAKTYVFGSELLEQHHADLLKGMKVPRQFDGFLNVEAPLLTNLAMGGPGSGVYFHRHDAAFSVVFYGAKRWMFYRDLPTAEDNTGADREHYGWAMTPDGFLDPTSNSSKSFAETRLDLLREEFDIEVCTQHATDLVFTPSAWHHSTVNLAETVGVAWREQFMESATSLEIAAVKWNARRRSGGIVGVTGDGNEGVIEGEAPAVASLAGAGGSDPSMVFDAWLSDEALDKVRREEDARPMLDRIEEAEANMPSREELEQKILERTGRA